MCRPTTCPTCGLWTLTGCGRHPQALDPYPEDQRCPGHP